MEPTRDHTLDGLTSTIVENSKIISNSIKDNGLPHLSFDVNGPAAFPVPPTFVAAQGARLALIEATKLLERLVVGPTETVQWIAMAVATPLPPFFHIPANKHSIMTQPTSVLCSASKSSTPFPWTGVPPMPK